MFALFKYFWNLKDCERKCQDNSHYNACQNRYYEVMLFQKLERKGNLLVELNPHFSKKIVTSLQIQLDFNRMQIFKI